MWLWPSTPRALSDQWIAYDAEVFLLSVCAVFPCQNTRNAAFVVIAPPVLQWEKAHHLNSTDTSQ